MPFYALQGSYTPLAWAALVKTPENRLEALDCGPMSGFDNEGVDREFFPGGRVKSNFICSIGYGDPGGLFDRLPWRSFNEVCQIV